MKTQKILSIAALVMLGLCLLCGLAKIYISRTGFVPKKGCHSTCGILIFVAVVLIGISQLLTEEEFTRDDSTKKYVPASSDTSIGLPRAHPDDRLYCPNSKGCDKCEVQIHDILGNSIEQLVCKTAVNRQRGDDRNDIYSFVPLKDARAVFTCGASNSVFSKNNDGYVCKEK